MSTDTVLELGRAWEEFKQANDARLEAIESKNYAPADLEEKVARIDSAIGGMEQKIADTQTALQRAAAVEAMSEQVDEHKNAFTKYITKGIDYDEKAMSVGDLANEDGGYAVPEGLQREIGRIITETSPVRQRARVVTITTNNYEKLVGQADAAAGWVAEAGSRTETDTPNIKQVLITPGEAYANAKASQRILDDAMFNVEQFLQEEVADKISRLENTAFVSGDGSDKPKGFLSYTKVDVLGTPEWGKLNNIETASTDTLAANDLIELVHTLKSGYRENGAFGMNRLFLSAVRKLKGSDAYYLYQPGLGVSASPTLLGYPVMEFNDMASSHTNGGGDTDAIVFADWKRFYTVVDRFGIRMLRDPYTAKPHVLFYCTKRVGGGIEDFNAGVVLTINDA